LGNPHDSIYHGRIIRMKSLLVMVCIAAMFAVESSRAWTTRDGRTFDAALSAVDGLRATLTPPGRPPIVV